MAKARGQFQQSLALETAGDFGGALNLLREVSAIKMTPQVRFHIATCEEGLGKLTAAVGDYQLALGDAQDSKADDVVQEATTRLAAAKARLPKIIIKRGKGAETAQISLDGVSLGSSSIGIEIAVDPGPHAIEARTPGAPPFAKQLDIAEKERKTMEVVLTKTIEAVAPPVTSGAHSPVEPPPPEEKKTTLVPYVVGGVGVASLAASGVFFLLRSGTVKDLDAACGPNRDACPSSSKSTFESGKTYTLLGDITLATGVVGVGVAMVLLLRKPSEPSTAALRLVPAAPSSGAGASLVGSF